MIAIGHKAKEQPQGLFIVRSADFLSLFALNVGEKNKSNSRIIYRILCTKNGLSYIGTTRSWYHRMHIHLHHLRHGTHNNKRLQSDWNQYQETSFWFEVLKSVPECESHYIEREFIEAAARASGVYNERAIGANRDINCIRKYIINEMVYVNIQGFAKMAGVSRQCVYNWLQEKMPLPSLKRKGCGTVIPIAEAIKWLEGRRFTSKRE